jgi:genome maintenance exonuclease 1
LTFNLNLLDLPKVTRIDGAMRLYETPDGKRYPSVTTILGNTADKTGLDIWRARVGFEAADRKTKRSSRRGTAVHNICEKLVLNQEVDLSKEMPLNKMMYKQLERKLIPNVDNIRCSEGYLFSHKLRCAGAVDLIADWRSKPSIVDFKTAEKYKKAEHIEDYFLQTSLYSFMLWEMTQLMYNNIVVLIATEDEQEAQIFEEKASNWLTKAKDRCTRFHKEFNI